MSRGLWIARAMPFPLDTGDRIYSAHLIKAVADAGADLTVVGFPGDAPVPGAKEWPVRAELVDGVPNGTARSLLNTMPLVAASHATRAYREKIGILAQEQWDFVVFDHYAMGWAIAPFMNASTGGRKPVLVHVAHDHEASVYASLVRGFKGSAFKRLGLWQNWLKTRSLERYIARSVDLVTSITAEDAERFAVDAPSTAGVVLTPGYTGEISSRPTLTSSVPRNVVMVGNYKWVAKSENLRQFVAAADSVFHRHGITLHVIGSMQDALAQELRRSAKATVLHGFVDDIAPHFANARIAVVPEEIGGGFKLKFLDYIFGRVPVATLTHAAAGLPEEIRSRMIQRKGVVELVNAIVETIDNVDSLDQLQRHALTAAQSRYRWEDRGTDLLAAIQQSGYRNGTRTSPEMSPT